MILESFAWPNFSQFVTIPSPKLVAHLAIYYLVAFGWLVLQLCTFRHEHEFMTFMVAYCCSCVDFPMTRLATQREINSTCMWPLGKRERKRRIFNCNHTLATLFVLTFVVSWLLRCQKWLFCFDTELNGRFWETFGRLRNALENTKKQ